MKKETLTKKNIMIDLKKALNKSIGSFILALILMFFSLLIVNLAFSIRDLGDLIWGGIFILLSSAIIIITAIDLYRHLYAYRNKLNIQHERLVEVKINEHYTGGFIPFRQHHNLIFARYGKYYIPKDNYTWSNEFHMDVKGVYNYSNIGDEYYLILSKDKKILLAYNMKLFELKEDANEY